MIMEVKSSQKAYQKATKQLFDGKERIEEVLSALGLSATAFKFVGVFYAHQATELPLFECDPCSTFAIVGEDNILKNLEKIDEVVFWQNDFFSPFLFT